MGIKLEGKPIELKNGSDILSSAVTFGTVQVPSDGVPIIMGADRQTIGGYARIANVISADLHILGQLHTGNTIQFKEVSLAIAHKLLKEQNSIIEKLYGKELS